VTLYAQTSLVADATYTVTPFLADRASLGDAIERALGKHSAARSGGLYGLPFLRVCLELDGWRGAWYSEELGKP